MHTGMFSLEVIGQTSELDTSSGGSLFSCWRQACLILQDRVGILINALTVQVDRPKRTCPVIRPTRSSEVNGLEAGVLRQLRSVYLFEYRAHLGFQFFETAREERLLDMLESKLSLPQRLSNVPGHKMPLGRGLSSKAKGPLITL